MLAAVAAAPAFLAQEYKPNLPADHPAIQYAQRPVHDAAAVLARKLDAGTITLAPRGVLGYLPDLLEQLRVPADSQMLVFSKTSFQASRISPDNPRAIYFSDDVAVGFVPGGQTLEVAAVDPVQGPIFYALSVGAGGKPALARGDTCLHCHHGPNTAGVPGLYVGSVIPGPTGAPLRDESAIITDHRSDFAERWGGWYVTARRGEQRDRANAVASNPANPETLVRESRQNLSSLAGLVDLSAYLVPTSDIVALMTFEHQTQMTNLITRVGWEARLADAALDADIDELVAYMLFRGEAALKEPIEGVSSFARTFPQRGPRDRRGRSLRELDLQTRLFKYPFSYMVYSAAFDALPDAVRDRIYRRLYDALTGAATRPLSQETGRAIVEILKETKPGLPAYWR